VANLTDIFGALTRGQPGVPGRAGDRLADLPHFGSNPGNLRARTYVPERVAARPALVVVLHGCTQNAAGYDHNAGWSRLADRHGFVLLFPEQSPENNPNLCFNWFLPGDARRDHGEALSIRQMIDRMSTDHKVDTARIFVTGLSAGGAMASAMLASYPEVFAGGAIIAGLGYGFTSGVPQALARMSGQGLPQEADLDRLLRGASDHDGAWPTISVWHGSADATVNPGNADAIVAQWRMVHGVSDAPDVRETKAGHTRRAWRNADGREVIEHYTVTGMAHGTPLDTQASDGQEVAGAHMIDAGISSTRHIAAFWGLTDAIGRADGDFDRAEPSLPTIPLPALRTIRLTPEPQPEPVRADAATGVGKVIEDALRAAGLMR